MKQGDVNFPDPPFGEELLRKVWALANSGSMVTIESLISSEGEASKTSEEYAKRRFNFLVKLGIIEQDGSFTDAGRRWGSSDRQTAEQAASEIDDCYFPDELNRFLPSDVDGFAKTFQGVVGKSEQSSLRNARLRKYLFQDYSSELRDEKSAAAAAGRSVIKRGCSASDGVEDPEGGEEKVQLTVKVPSSMHKRFKLLCIREGVSMESVVLDFASRAIETDSIADAYAVVTAGTDARNVE